MCISSRSTFGDKICKIFKSEQPRKLSYAFMLALGEVWLLSIYDIYLDTKYE